VASERSHLSRLYKKLVGFERRSFPGPKKKINAPDRQGVYLIRSPSGKVLHVGRTYRGKRGLAQRLKNHLHGSSSFVKECFDSKGSKLRRGYTFQFVEVEHPRLRALLEAYTTGQLCPKHIGESLSRSE
jgi:excinuclease UvrABC nuclease subunit